MGLYCEIECDAKIARDDIGQSICFTDIGDGAQAHTLAAARADARRSGWKIGPGRAAICPACLAYKKGRP